MAQNTDTVVDLRETLADIIPNGVPYVLEAIQRKPGEFKADFHINCSTKTEATNFVAAYCSKTR